MEIPPIDPAPSKLVTTAEILAQLKKAPAKEQKRILDATTKQIPQCFIPSPGPQSLAYHSRASILLYGGAAGGGKLLRLSERLVTPAGFTTMGEVRVGDELIDMDGLVCRVQALSAIDPAPELWRLTFDDGTSAVSCADHQWVTYNAKELSDLLRRDEAWKAQRRASRPSRALAIKTKSAAFYAALLKRNQTIKPEPMPLPTGSVRTTREIAGTLVVHAKSRRNHAIPLCASPNLPHADLLVPPYTLGAWLGDGTAVSGGFTGVDREIWERIERDGFEVRHSVANDGEHYIQKLKVKLREIGVLGNKHIPQKYLRASHEQRLELLRGLMDTDGTVARVSGSAEFCNTNEAIIDGMCELIASLGWKVHKREGRAMLYGRYIGKKWTLKFLPDEVVFSLQRKASIQGIAKRRSQKFRYIEKAERVESEAGRCITVDSPTRTYLISGSFLPTHNTSLINGLALTCHEKSLIMRRQYTDLTPVIEDCLRLYGTRDGFNGSSPPSLRTMDKRFIQFGAASQPGDEQNFKGSAHDLKSFDEVVDFLEAQVRFIIGWNRSINPKQRCRVVFASNPPTSSTGDWIVGMFRPWLDVTHGNPAKDGELRWFLTDRHGKDIEVDSSEPKQDGYNNDGTPNFYKPLSRTFIRSSLSDNPFLVNTSYKSTLDAMPEPYRSAYRDGNFMLARKDSENQLIPTSWVIDAQARWTPQPPSGVPMCAIGVDPAAGGPDETVLALRYDGYYATLICIPGVDTPYPQDVAAKVMRYRKGDAVPIIDCGGGYGGGVVRHLDDNGIPCKAHKGAEGSNKRTKDRMYGFASKRAEVYWRFMEALDPSQDGGSQVALPPDPMLLSDLTSVHFSITGRGVTLESKVDMKKRLGRSPDRGDAVVIANSYGETLANQRNGQWGGERKNVPKSIMSYPNRRRLK